MASSLREIILTSSPDRPITAYDPLTGTTLAHFSGSRSPRKGLTLVGNTLIAASHISSNASGFIRLYNWWSSAALHCIPVPEPVAPLAATPDGSYLFSGGLSGHIYAHSLPSGDLHRSFRAHGQTVSCLTINDDGSLLISGGDDGAIAVFPILRILDTSQDDDDSAQLALYQFPAHSLSVTGIASSPGGCNATMVSSSLDCTCKFWSLADGVHLRTVWFPCAVWCVVMDPTNSEMYSGGSDGQVYVVPLKFRGRRLGANEAEAVAWTSEQSGAVMAVAMANGNQNLISASEDGIVKIWEVERRSVVRVLGHERGSISDLVVAKGATGTSGVQIRDEEGGFSRGNPGFCEREMCRQVREVGELEEWLGAVVKDRRRALDTFEAAIGTYEKLLGLFLREVKQGKDKEEAKNLDPSP